MVLKLKDQFFIQEIDNFEGKKEKILRINCSNCKDINKDKYNNKKCIKCILEAFYSIRNKKISFILFNDQTYKSESVKILSLFNYFNNLDDIIDKLLKIKNIRRKRCKYKGFQCKILNKDFFDFSSGKEQYINPLFVYNLVKKKIIEIKKEQIYDSICSKCVSSIENILQSILKILNQLYLIKQYHNYKKNKILSQNNSKFYENYFKTYLLNRNNPQHIKQFSLRKEKSLLETYKIGEDNLYRIFIYKIPNEFERFYHIELCFKSKSQQEYFSKIVEDVENNLKGAKINTIIPLESLIKLYINEASLFINSKYKFTKENIKKLAFLASIQKIHFQKLFPLLIDDNIEEIFLDSPYDKIYVNHQKYGRCRTEIELNLQEIERFKTFLRLYSGKSIDYVNPSIKLVLKNKYFYCRFATDIAPINLNEFSLDIRKLNKNIFTIQDLLKNGTLNPKMAAYLYFNLLRKFNITATGETNTGKTTLINALDLLVPKDFRKIYVESISESLNQTNLGRHQLKFKVDSIENFEMQKNSKHAQIKRLLHRTPDLIYLGEILTKQEAEAMFHCLSAGLRGFQTIHSNDLDSLINRFLYHFKIDPSCLKDLDLLVLMKKIHHKRKIISISEINQENSSTQKRYKELFKYNPKTGSWNLLTDLSNTNTIRKTRIIENLDEEKLYKYIEIYENVFNFLLNYNKMVLKELIDLFNEICYFSFTSLKQLEKFWYSWKQSRSLNS